MTSPRRILIITRNLPPLVGGMERLNWHMAEELAKLAEVRVVGPAGAAAVAPAGVVVREAPLKPLWKFLLRARALARREARGWKPDIVLAGSGLTAPIARAAARTCGAKTAVYVHGLDVAVKHPVYRAVWFPAIRRMDRVIANSHATADICRGIGVDPARIGIVHPGVDLPGDSEPSPGAACHPLPEGEGTAFEPLPPRERGRGEGTNSRGVAGAQGIGNDASDEPSPGAARHPLLGSFLAKQPPARAFARALVAARTAPGSSQTPLLAPGGEGNAALRARHNLGDRPLLLSVGRLSVRKGLREFVANSLPQIVAAYPDVMLLIVGDAPMDALHAKAQTPESIRAVAAAAGVAENLSFLGTITDYELGTVYRACDVHVFPVREIPGDPEGFGMVAIEAAAHGLPTVAFSVGGVPDAVVEGESGSLIRASDYRAFAASVNSWLARAERAAIAVRCIAAAEPFSWQNFGRNLCVRLGLAKC